MIFISWESNKIINVPLLQFLPCLEPGSGVSRAGRSQWWDGFTLLGWRLFVLPPSDNGTASLPWPSHVQPQSWSVTQRLTNSTDLGCEHKIPLMDPFVHFHCSVWAVNAENGQAHALAQFFCSRCEGKHLRQLPLSLRDFRPRPASKHCCSGLFALSYQQMWGWCSCFWYHGNIFLLSLWKA